MQLKTLVVCLVLFLIFGSVSAQTLLQDIMGKLRNSTENSTDIDETEMARRRRRRSKYAYLLLGALIFKSVVIPLTFKAMAVMSAVAIFLSTLSLIISSIVGYVKTAVKSTPPAIRVLAKFPQSHSWAKDDESLANNYFSIEPSLHHFDQKVAASGDHYFVTTRNGS